MYFGGPTNAVDSVDADNDGASNLQEYLAGTNPTNASSVLRLLRAQTIPATNGFLVSWASVSNKSYDLLRTTNLSVMLKAVALHRLVGIHRVPAGRVEAGQPHVAHDDDLEGVSGVLEPVCQLAAFLLVADVPLPLGAGEVRIQKCEVRNSVSSSFGIRHSAFSSLAVHRLHPLLEMRHQIGGDERDAIRVAHQRLQRGPLGFSADAVVAPRLLHPAGCASLHLSRGIPCRSALLFRLLLASAVFLKLRVELRQFGDDQGQLGEARIGRTEMGMSGSSMNHFAALAKVMEPQVWGRSSALPGRSTTRPSLSPAQ